MTKLTNEIIEKRLKEQFAHYDIRVEFPYGNNGGKTYVIIVDNCNEKNRKEGNYRNLKGIRSFKVSKQGIDYTDEIKQRLSEIGYTFIGPDDTTCKKLTSTDKFSFYDNNGIKYHTSYANQKKHGFKFLNCGRDVYQTIQIVCDNYSKKEIDVANVSDGKSLSTIRVHLQCRKCGYKWSTSLTAATYQDSGCMQCQGKVKHSQEWFINKVKKIRPEYDYTESIYNGLNKNVKVICHERNKYGVEHGAFYPIAGSLVNGSGCPHCLRSSLEDEVNSFLSLNNIEFETQKKFHDLGKQRFDFYIPSQKTAIECQGKQHFESVIHFGGEDGFKNRLKLDIKKRAYCKEHNIALIYYTHEDVDSFLNIKCVKSLGDLSGLIGLTNIKTDLIVTNVISSKESKLKYKELYNKCRNSAKKYYNRTEWSNKDSSLFYYAAKYGWIDELMPINKRKHWTLELWIEYAKDCDYILSVMHNKYPDAYSAGYKYGWIKQYLHSIKEKGVSVFDINNEIIYTFTNRVECCERIKCSKSALTNCIQRKQPFKETFVFRDWVKDDGCIKNDNKLDELIEGINNKYKVIQFSIDGKFIKLWNNANEVFNAFNGKFSVANLYRSLNTRNSELEGFQWIYYKDWDGKEIEPLYRYRHLKERKKKSRTIWPKRKQSDHNRVM